MYLRCQRTSIEEVGLEEENLDRPSIEARYREEKLSSEKGRYVLEDARSLTHWAWLSQTPWFCKMTKRHFQAEASHERYGQVESRNLRFESNAL